MPHSIVYVHFVVPLILVGGISNCPVRGQEPAKDTPIPARVFTSTSREADVKSVVVSLAQDTGLEVDISAIDGSKPIRTEFKKAEFWKVVDSLAEQTGSRVLIGSQGKPVRLIPNPSNFKPFVWVDGPFRIAAREIEARRDLITGKAYYDLTLEIAWEARLPVFRMDAVPNLEKAEDDAGQPITVKPIATRNAVEGVVFLSKVRLEGLSGESKRIARLQGSYLITAAEGMLRTSFKDLTNLPMTVKEQGVGVTLKKFAKEGTFWIADIDLSYPPGGPIFESFENYWLGRNRITLLAPDGKTRVTTMNEEINGSTVRYRFKETKDFKPADTTVWKLEYETTGVMREVRVNFDLKGIPLP